MNLIEYAGLLMLGIAAIGLLMAITLCAAAVVRETAGNQKADLETDADELLRSLEK